MRRVSIVSNDERTPNEPKAADAGKVRSVWRDSIGPAQLRCAFGSSTKKGSPIISQC
jgi:hypothetical protein